MQEPESRRYEESDSMQTNQNPYQTPVAAGEVTLQQQQVLRNTYLLLALSLIPTGIGALIGINLNFAFVRASPIVSSLVLLAVIYGMFFAIEKNPKSGPGGALLLGLTFFLGIVLGPLLQGAIGFLRGGAHG